LTKKKKAGPKTIYTKALGKKICDRISRGELLQDICDDLKKPAYRTAIKWIKTNEDFNQQYSEARDIFVDREFDGLIKLSDEAIGMESASEVAGLTLRLKVRQWVIERMAPEKYAPKSTTKIIGDVNQPIGVKSTSDMNDNELLAKVQNLLKA